MFHIKSRFSLCSEYCGFSQSLQPSLGSLFRDNKHLKHILWFFVIIFSLNIMTTGDLNARACMGFFSNKANSDNKFSRKVETYNVDNKNYIVEKYSVGPSYFYEKTIGFMEQGKKYKLFNIGKYNDTIIKYVISLFNEVRKEGKGKKWKINNTGFISYESSDGNLLLTDSDYNSVLGFIPISMYGLNGKISFLPGKDKKFYLAINDKNSSTALLNPFTGKLYVYANSKINKDELFEYFSFLTEFTESINTPSAMYIVNDNIFFASSNKDGGKIVFDTSGKSILVIERNDEPLTPNVVSRYIEEHLNNSETLVNSEEDPLTSSLNALKEVGVNRIINNFFKIRETKAGKLFVYGKHKFASTLMDNGDLMITDDQYSFVINVLPLSDFREPKLFYVEKGGYTYLLVKSKNGSALFDLLTGSSLIYSKKNITKKTALFLFDEMDNFAKTKGFLCDIYLVDEKVFFVTPDLDGYRIVYDEKENPFLKLDFKNKDYSPSEVDSIIRKYYNAASNSVRETKGPMPIGFL